MIMLLCVLISSFYKIEGVADVLACGGGGLLARTHRVQFVRQERSLQWKCTISASIRKASVTCLRARMVFLPAHTASTKGKFHVSVYESCWDSVTPMTEYKEMIIDKLQGRDVRTQPFDSDVDVLNVEKESCMNMNVAE